MRSATKAQHRWLLLLVVACAGLAVPSSAASDGFPAQRHVDGTLGAHGWYVSNVHVYWTFNPQPDDSAGCDAKTLTKDGGTPFHCVATWISPPFNFDDPFTVSVDKTPPAVHGVLGRPPDANGWYNKPVTISFAGTDATSGMAGCSSTSYGGPDSATAVVSGSCTDNAGNVGQASVHLAYDADPPPPPSGVTVKHGDRTVLLRWAPSSDTKVVQVMRSGAKEASKLIYSGAGSTCQDRGLRAGANYTYTLTAFDEASNSTAETVAVTATGRLINPVPGQTVTSPPRLSWLAVKGASYYNIQMIRGHRVLSAWPVHANFKVPVRWRYHGHHYKLRHGVYRWYVWPGFGVRAKAKYGRMIGGSTFRYAG